MILEKVRTPIVLAPLAGGPSTPELAAAVSRAGGLGFLAAGYLSPAELGRRMGTTRDLAAGPIAVNLFAPGAGPAEPSVYGPFLDRLANWAQAEGMELGEPRYSEDEWEA